MDKPLAISLDTWRELFIQRIAKDGQRSTPQRLLIAETLYHHGHLNADELHQKVRLDDPTVGYATVYRTLKLLEHYGLVHASNFRDGTSRYEVQVGGDEHHDHMICTKCGAIVEFENDAIEQLQKEIAKSHGFTLTSHRMDLYGLCPNCVGLLP